MFWLIASVSESVSSSVWRPTTARSVVWAIWLIAASTFSIATRPRLGPRPGSRPPAETSTLTLSLVMIPCDWIGRA